MVITVALSGRQRLNQTSLGVSIDSSLLVPISSLFQSISGICLCLFICAVLDYTESMLENQSYFHSSSSVLPFLEIAGVFLLKNKITNLYHDPFGVMRDLVPACPSYLICCLSQLIYTKFLLVT